MIDRQAESERLTHLMNTQITWTHTSCLCFLVATLIKKRKQRNEVQDNLVDTCPRGTNKQNNVLLIQDEFIIVFRVHNCNGDII